MKRIAILFMLLLPLSMLAQTQEKLPKGVTPDSTGYIIRVGQTVPDIKWTQTDGKTVSIKDLRGKVVMLQFTASWCGVCRREMPFIERDIWQKHKDNKKFYLVGIDRDEPKATVEAFAKQTGVTYPLALDPGADLFAKFALRESGITRNVLVDRDGKIVMTTRLYNEKEFQLLVKKIDSLLKGNQKGFCCLCRRGDIY